jgi:hypothetical protein
MKRTKGLLITLLSLIMAASFVSTPVFATDDGFSLPPILTLSAPEQQQRRFDINGKFDLWTLSNIYTSIILCTGNADDLTITLSLHSQLDSKDYLDYMMVVVGLGTSAAIFDGPNSITTPYAITSVIDLDSTFAVMALVAIITSVSDGIEEAGKDAFPLEFTVTFDLTETAAVTP